MYGHSFTISSSSLQLSSPLIAKYRKRMRPTYTKLVRFIDRLDVEEKLDNTNYMSTTSLRDILDADQDVGAYKNKLDENGKNSECSFYDSCYLDHHEDGEEYENDFIYSIPVTKSQNNMSFFTSILMIPVVTPFLAYLTYDDIARSFNFLFDLIARERNWNPVDGGAYQAKIIAPAINGIVVPAISILFATMTSNTVSTLRQRQIDIHTYLNTEAGDLRLLSMLVDSFPDSEYKSKCRVYLRQYTSRLIVESKDSETSKVMFGSTDSEMNGFVTTLNGLVMDFSEGGDGNGEGKKKNRRPPDTILSESYGAVVRLNSIRSSRITALQSTFPALHYGILGLLASSICVAFLLETNQELLIFLNAIQLRVLWTMLIGSISALGVVCWDLSFPFTGTYIISNAVDQLKTIRDMIKATDINESEHKIL